MDTARRPVLPSLVVPRSSPPVVSVVLPVRNAAATIARAIGSVRAQT